MARARPGGESRQGKSRAKSFKATGGGAGTGTLTAGTLKNYQGIDKTELRTKHRKTSGKYISDT